MTQVVLARQLANQAPSQLPLQRLTSEQMQAMQAQLQAQGQAQQGQQDGQMRARQVSSTRCPFPRTLPMGTVASTWRLQQRSRGSTTRACLLGCEGVHAHGLGP